jgi:hypothetical protein
VPDGKRGSTRGEDNVVQGGITGRGELAGQANMWTRGNNFYWRVVLANRSGLIS